ncbi:YecA family protein [Aggregatibacter actinomycetemcomitans]|uniref:YecA/YgfB family protein n=1 Tax=Aggregatibacter actinomycetemcomitans TaxID=714 RepID=UPI00197B32CA|nr:YecA family protein [Aggregatibacter actinomycetemcomitans]MBN6067914.1 YecA family protein [Aggregatibacter actinomycetemcomitans]MBN6085851.1 YecA family protein [Aggregatibacter actinomycetemcomitans]
MTTISYQHLNQQLHQASVLLSAAELHGFLSGLICGGVQAQSWQPLLYQFTNDNHAYPIALLQQISDIYQQIRRQLADNESFDFELCLPETENVFEQADGLAEWSNHFLLGLGLAQPHLDKEKGDIGEAVDDLRDICQLGYDEEDDPEELAQAVEEIVEYVRTIATLFFTHFNQTEEKQPTLH